MDQQVPFHGQVLNYRIMGSGTPIVFLHGYLESLEIWGGFPERFAHSYRVICVDIPGHGMSGTLGEEHHMEVMADAVTAVLSHAAITERAVLVGHSMGGYVTMEFVARYPELTKGYVLFHSTCFADSEEKRLNRDREISLVKCGKKKQIVRTNIPKAFADDNHDSLTKEISRCKEIAAGTTDEGIVALLRGMQQRKDHSATLANAAPPALIIWGKKDNYIGKEALDRMLEIAPQATVMVLKESGHMGFLEEPDCAVSGMNSFLGSLG